MTKFTFSAENHSQQYIKITAEFKTSTDETIVQLPAWRPGRYELANFAKYVRDFKVCNSEGRLVAAEKQTKDSWKIDTSATDSILVEYSFYANIINAGSTFLDEEQLYVNPVNCCVYTEESFNNEVSVKLNVPAYWEVATSMEKVGEDFKVANFDELLDSPFIASSKLQHGEYESNGTIFHIWFNGEVKPDWPRIIKDFKAFTDKQIERFTEFPVKEYHFLNQILPYKAYHGVEHQKSTVISLGPSYDIFGSLYKELMGVSSHELYHTWNVKAIRPIEMYPYDFSKENYSKLGYICEGITTYQGDLFLLKSGFFSEEDYLKELTSQLQRHFDNFGRFNYSVAESSFDTWLDGYSVGAPSRKVSIYTEGCLLTFVIDVQLRKATDNKYGIDEVMKRLFFNFGLKNKGVSENDYQSLIESISGESYQIFFDDYFNGTKAYELIITEALDVLGLELIHKPSNKYNEGRLGFKTQKKGSNEVVTALYPSGPADLARLTIGDEIIAVNDFPCSGALNKWLNYFDDDTKTVTVLREGRMISLTFPEVNRNFYMTYSISKIDKPTRDQNNAYNSWKK
ncbi:MAG TPA: M61 family peptidase [Crocinitomicaceae bacterium]|nr:M61 family peptidase [Crocinitomicaceae bacterium]